MGFSVSTEDIDCVWDLEVIQSKHFPNVWIDKETGELYILDEKHGVTHKITVPPVE